MGVPAGTHQGQISLIAEVKIYKAGLYYKSKLQTSLHGRTNGVLKPKSDKISGEFEEERGDLYRSPAFVNIVRLKLVAHVVQIADTRNST